MNTVEEADAPIPAIDVFPRGAQPHPEFLTQTLDLLAGAERPVMVVGSEVLRRRGGAALARLVERTGIPAFADYEGGGLLSGLGDGSGGFIQNLYTFKDARPDAVLLLGVRFGLHTWHGAGMLIPHDASVIQVDPDARESGRLQAVTLAITADPAATLEALDALAATRPWADRTGWRGKVRALIDRRTRAIEARAHDRLPLHPWRAVNAIADRIDDHTVVVADGAESYLWLTEVMSRTAPAGFLTHGYLGCMGVGMGNALGAQVARPDKRVLFVVGDGSVGYSIAEFDSLVRHRLPVIVIVLNNRSWGATLHFQEFVAGANRITNTRLENGDYEDVAKAFGADSYRADTLEAFEAALDAALAKHAPACINVRIDLNAIPPEEMVMMGQDPFAD